MVEVLVAVLILSFGLLGLAALQATGMRENRGAVQRSQATLLAADIVDRMLANREKASAGEYDITLGTNPSASLPQAILDDLTQWKNALKELPGPGDGSVQVANRMATITIRWSINGENNELSVQARL